ncbi:MAG: exonuclease subunit SbcD [Saprospiraceae bacterium]
MIKVLHTADWHIGKSLYRQPLEQEMSLFFNWLSELLIRESIDVLLISGDIFDYSNPTHQDTTRYYDFLTKMASLGIKVIITGGNHDSISMLNAPSELLKTMNIDVFGGVKTDLFDHIIPIFDNEEVVAVVAAIPFLRNKDIKGSANIDALMESIADEESAIADIYFKIVTEITLRYPGVPIIAMGHLYMRGAITSDSERDIHIGTLQGINKPSLPPQVSYYALGHIHKPQLVGNDEMCRYSGSPIFLDFSERYYTKQVLQLKIENKTIKDITSHPIPIFRNVSSHKGDFNSIQLALDTISVSDYGLKEYVDLTIEAEQLDSFETSRIVQFIESNLQTDTYIIARYKVISKTNETHFLENTYVLNELSPMNVFEKFLESKDLDSTQVSALKMCYSEILELIQASET